MYNELFKSCSHITLPRADTNLHGDLVLEEYFKFFSHKLLIYLLYIFPYWNWKRNIMSANIYRYIFSSSKWRTLIVASDLLPAHEHSPASEEGPPSPASFPSLRLCGAGKWEAPAGGEEGRSWLFPCLSDLESVFVRAVTSSFAPASPWLHSLLH